MKHLFAISNTMQMMRRHRFVLIIIIIQLTIVFSLVGLLFHTGEKVEKNIEHFEQIYGGKSYYPVTEFMTDVNYYKYYHEDQKKNINNLRKLKERLYQEEIFQYISIDNQFVDIENNKIEDCFLTGYEDGDFEWCQREENGTQFSSVKTLHVSEKFFENFQLKIYEGETLCSEDYVNNEDVFPVILGAEYKKYYHVGDTIEGQYESIDTNFFIKGFLTENSFYFDPMKQDMISLDYYMILPATTNEKSTETIRIQELQQLPGILVSDYDFETVSSCYKKIVEECEADIFESGIMTLGEGEKSLIEIYSSMTKEVEKQYTIILAVVILFAVISTIYIILGFIQEEKERYAVSILCGATMFDLIEDIVLLCGMIHFTSGVLAILISSCIRFNKYSIVAILILVFLCCILETCIMIFQMYRFDTKDIIGGRE